MVRLVVGQVDPLLLHRAQLGVIQAGDQLLFQFGLIRVPRFFEGFVFGGELRECGLESV